MDSRINKTAVRKRLSDSLDKTFDSDTTMTEAIGEVQKSSYH